MKKVIDVEERLQQARIKLLQIAPFYGQIAMQMSWCPDRASPPIDTMGVRLVRSGVECCYNPDFVAELTLYELMAVIQHEIEHISRQHCLRLASTMDPVVFNIAADMCVNGQCADPRIGFALEEEGEKIIPFKDQLAWIPRHWDDSQTAEWYYAEILKSKRGSLSEGRILDDHSIWAWSELSDAEMQGLTKSIVRAAASKCPGHVPGHLERLIEGLGEAQVKWDVLLRRYMNQYLGGKRTSWARRNRRRDVFGVPGYRRLSHAKISVCVDVSGSISHEELHQFFAEIEKMIRVATIDVVLWDCGKKPAAFWRNYQPGDYQRIRASGGGGTNLAAAYAWLLEQRVVGDCVVMLTDGYTPWPNRSSGKYVPLIAAISSSDATPPRWVKAVYLDR